MDASSSFPKRLAGLTVKSLAAQRQSPQDIDWDRPAALPFWMPRRLAASAITHFYKGELATANMCTLLRDRLGLEGTGDFLDLQTLDEQRHAALYTTYIDRLGGFDRRPSNVDRAYERAMAWRGAPQAIILAFHGVLEGESMRLQQEIDKWLPCPLFKDISSSIARDEARHIAFGRLYLQESLPALPRTERLEIFRWIRELWFDAVRGAIGRFAPPGILMTFGGVSGWMANEWEERLDDLETFRLFQPLERQEFLTS